MKHLFKKTKVVCTIGPASENVETLTKLAQAGMNIARLNFSHGSHEEHLARIKMVRQVSESTGINLGVALDTKGPEIRLGNFVNDTEEYQIGEIVYIEKAECDGTHERFHIQVPELFDDLASGNEILINDGKMRLTVLENDGNELKCRVEVAGPISSHKGCNVPGVKLSMPFLSEKDEADIRFGCQNNVDFIFASFTRRPADVNAIRKICIEEGKPHINIIAKIENQEGYDNVSEILDAADGVMVARGDLGVEIPAEDVPLIQKELINKCRAAGKIVITATQMLDSMQENPRPTRAEVSDVANAIYDGTDAIMLSGESAQGKYPVEAVETMTKIALKTEGTLDYASLQRKAIRTAPLDQSEAICMSVAEIASKFNVAAIVAFTDSGFTARKMSRYRTKSMIIAATPNEQTTRALAINWGVKSVLCKQMDTRAAMIEYAQVIAKENLVEPGEQIIVTAGTPGVAGTTSYLELITVK